MESWGLTPHIDATLVILYLFWAFFIWLVFYIQQEGRREGFPLVSDPSGEELNQDLWMPSPKVYYTNDGRTVYSPDPARADTRDLPLAFVPGGPGSPLMATTDTPLLDSVGPAAYAERPDVPDLTYEGDLRLVPMRMAPEWSIAEQDIDPRGVTVYGADGEEAGVVTDVWVDRSEYIMRYLELQPTGGLEGQTVLLPVNTMDIRGNKDFFMDFIRMKKGEYTPSIHVNAILASQFKDVPKLSDPGRITYLDEEKIQAYYGGGFLFATPDRAEPLI